MVIFMVLLVLLIVAVGAIGGALAGIQANRQERDAYRKMLNHP